MADLNDILTTFKNAVIALNALNQTQTDLSYAQGTHTSPLATTSTLVTSGPGRAVRVSVTVAGSATGTLNDASSVGSAAAGNAIYAIPNTAGVHELGLYYTNGLVIVPGTGQSVNVTWSEG